MRLLKQEINSKYEYSYSVIFLVFIILNVFVSFSFWKDESWYIADAKLFENMGLNLNFLKGIKGPPGPLYGIFHGTFSSLFDYQILITRALNLLLFVGYGFFNLKIIEIIQKKGSNSEKHNYLLYFFALPVLAPVWGTAITESPALLFMSLAIYLLFRSLEETFSSSLFFASAVCLTIAFSGRQNFLAILVFLPYLLFYKRVSFVNCLIYGLIACSIPFSLFYLWGGLTPPAVGFVGKGLSLFHLGLSFAYAGALYFLLKIESLWTSKKILLLIWIVASTLSFVFFDGARIPLKGLAKALLPSSVVPFYAKISIALLMSFGILFVIDLSKELKKFNFEEKLFCLIHIMPLLTTIKINHLFSGRYIAASTPLVLYVALRNQKLTWSLFIRSMLGVLLSGVILYMYYKRANQAASL